MPDRVGVQLAADDASKYFATLDKVNKVTDILVGTTNDLVGVLGLLEKEERDAGRGAKGMGDDVEQGSKKLLSFDKIAEGAAHKVGALLVDGFRTAASAVLDFTKDSVKVAGDFEAGMNTFEAAAGSALTEGGQSIEQFRDLFIQMGRDLPVSTQEVQQAAVEMAKGGIEPATIAAGGLERVLKFAAAGNLDLAQAAEIAAKTIGGWTAVTASAADKATFLNAATDLMAKAAGAASVDVDELARGLYNAQGQAKASGVSFAETVTTLTALAPGFSSSAEAGTGFKNFLVRLQPQATDAKAALAELGLVTKDGTSAFYDARGQFIGMEKASGLLQNATKGLSQAERAEKLQRLLGNDAMGVGIRLAELGSDGYHKLADDIAKQNGVSEQAAKKQQGFNVAVENLMGSLEALQITAATKVLPSLTRLVNVFAGGVNAITSYVDATMEGKTALSAIAGFISDTAVPALAGLTAAATAYAIVQTIQATPAILASIPAIAAQTAAFVANAAAVAVALAPYVALAAVVAGIAFAYKGLQESVASVTDKVLAGSQAWQDSVQALETYDAAGEKTKAAAQGQADALRSLQTEQRGAIEQYALHVAAYEEFGAASGQTAESLDQERLAINARGNAIVQATTALNDQIVATEAEEQAVLNAQAASITATSVTNDLANATSRMGDQAALTKDDIQKLTEKIADIKDKGGAALQSYASTYSTFFSSVEQRQAEHADKIAALEAQKAKATTAEQKKGIDEQIAQANQAYADQETAAAESYVRQQEEQRKHLGQMLLDYTAAQATLATTDEGRRDRLLAVAQTIEKEYGLQQSSSTSTFLAMTRAIDSFSKDSGQSIDTLIGKLRDQETQAKNTQHTEDTYYHDSAAAAATTFAEKGGNVNTYIDTLNKIPTDVESVMHLPDIEDREQEIRDINRGLLQIPKEVRIHISVKDDVPPEYKPGSPTPFEIGIRGIIKALGDLDQQHLAIPGMGAQESPAPYTEALRDVVDAYQEIGAGSPEVGEAVTKLADTFGLSSDEATQLGLKLNTVMQAYEEVGAGSPEVGEAVAAVADQLGLTGDQAIQLGLQFNQLIQTMGGATEPLTAFADQLANSDLPDDAKDLGDNIMEGWSDGMYRAFDDLLDQVDEMSEKLIDRMNEAWDTHSPSGVTEELGDNIMTGLLNSLDAKLPDILATISDITASMMEGMNDLTDEMRKQLEDRLETIADTVEKLPDLINDALVGAYDSTADFLRLQSSNLQSIFDLSQGGQGTAQLAEQGAALDKQIAERRAKLADIKAGRLIIGDEDRKKIEQELTDLSAQRAQNAKEQADAEKEQQQRLELQKRTQDQLAKATKEASAMDDPAKAAAFLKLRSQQILRLADLEKQRLETTDPKQRALIDAQIALEKKAQEAELKSFDLQKDQIGVTLDLIEALKKLNENLDIPPITTDPALNALRELLTYLNSLVPKAGGGTMAAMQPYLVGERGPELIIPERDSQILNTLDTRRALAPATTIGGATTTYYGPSYTIMVDARGSNLTEGQIAGAVRRGMDAEGARADVRIRTGVE